MGCLGNLLWLFFGGLATALEYFTPGSGGCLDTLMNVIWFFIGGFYIFLTHVFFGCLLYITIVGIPWGQMNFRLARLALWPFGKRVV